MKIVFIGSDDTLEAIEHIIKHREAGDDVFVPGDSTGEQLVRRIMDADEIHIWDITDEFKLGMVYFFAQHALHHKLRWAIKLFGDFGKLTPLFAELANVCPTCGGKVVAQDELGWKDCPECGDDS